MTRVLRQPARTLNGIGLLSHGERVIGEARYRLQVFHLHGLQRGPTGSLIQQRTREVYGDGELLGDARLTDETQMTLHLRDGRSFSFVALPHNEGRAFDIVPAEPAAASHDSSATRADATPAWESFKPSRG